MLTKIALAAALVLGAASFATAADNDQSNGGYRSFGPGGAATTGINAAQHPRAAAACAKLRSYDASTMTYVGNDGKRHPCP